MQRVIEITDPDVIRALAHPLRRQVLSALTGRRASPRELALELDQSLPKVSYHVRQLASAGLIELVAEEPRRGVVEHFYVATARRRSLSPVVYAALPPETQQAFAGAWYSDLHQTIEKQLGTGAYSGENARLSRLTVDLDADGRDRLVRALDDLCQLALDLEESAGGRDAPTDTVVLISMLTDPDTGVPTSER